MKKVYDYADYDQPNTKEWFQLKNIEGRTQDRDYVVDHILPWDMYPRFLMGQKGKTNKQNENMQKRDSADSDEDEEEDADPKLCKTLYVFRLYLLISEDLLIILTNLQPYVLEEQNQIRCRAARQAGRKMAQQYR